MALHQKSIFCQRLMLERLDEKVNQQICVIVLTFVCKYLLPSTLQLVIKY